MTRPILALLLLPMLVACVPPAPSPAPPRVVRPRPPEPPPPPPPEPEAAVPGRWSFSIANGVCSATLANPALRLAVAAGPRARLTLTASAMVAPNAIAFAQTTGAWHGASWQWRMQPVGAVPGARVARASLALDEAEQGRLRDLLAGGTLRFTGADAAPLLLSVPDAGISGRDWFGCVAQRAEAGEAAGVGVAPPPAPEAKPGDGASG